MKRIIEIIKTDGFEAVMDADSIAAIAQRYDEKEVTEIIMKSGKKFRTYESYEVVKKVWLMTLLDESLN